MIEKPPPLTSWKEIAAFFGRDVRTVQRWEREGLPVHRRPGGRRSGVFAYPDEITRWLAGRPEPDGDRSEEPPAPAPPIGRRPALWFIAVAAALVAATAGVSWTARRPKTASGAEGRILATSREPLRNPRWANLDGSGGADLIVTTARSPVLIFRDARDRECLDDAAAACADTRIHAPEACWMHVNHAADVNADGIDDLLIACILREPESFTATGPTWIVWGRREWPRELEMPADAGVTIATAARHDDRASVCLIQHRSADLNQDGIADVLLGAGEAPFMDRRSAGAVYAFFGRRDWPAALAHADADVTIGGSRTGEGLSGCAVGDFDGDGIADLAVSGDEDKLWNMLGGIGRAYVVRGRASWPRSIDLGTEPAMRVTGHPGGMKAHLMQLADLDGDGKDELIVPAPSPADPRRTPLLAIFRGGPIVHGARPLTGADVVFEGEPGTRFGITLADGDLDGDEAIEILAVDAAERHVRVHALTDVALQSRAAPRVATLQAAVHGAWEETNVSVAADTLAVVTAEPGRWHVRVTQPFLPLTIDVRPGNNDDVVLVPGVTAIAIAGSREAGTLNPATLRAAGARPIGHSVIDFNGDGIDDIVAQFRTEDLRVSQGAAKLSVVGRTAAGRYARGEALVRVISVSSSR